jgi:L-aspartate oxidase
MRDTERAGAGLCSASAVQILCSEGPERVRDLIRFGVDFDRDESGIARGLEAGHSRSRVVHAGGDATGHVVENALVATARQRAAQPHARLQVLEHTMLTDLSVVDGRVTGARLLHGGRPGLRFADAVILATGGAGMLYRHTTNPAVATGDGLAAAWRAGAPVADLEFYQFHPTALAVPGTPLVSEAVRGEGAVLLSRDGNRFMIAEHPDAELAPRDVVARGIARQMAAQSGEPVVLDATALGRELLERRFPTITAACRAAGLDWARQPIPVAPAAHYCMGGIVTDTWGRSTLPGLFAVGEVARTGAHGANRLASNSLLEAAVFADRAVRALGSEPGIPTGTTATLIPTPTPAPSSTTAASTATSGLRGALQDLMWESAGVHRSGAGLTRAVQTLAGWSTAERPHTVAEQEDRNLLDVARITVAAALERQESRGAHHRADFPDPRAELAVSSAWTIAAALPHPLHPDDVDPEPQEAMAC